MADYRRRVTIEDPGRLVLSDLPFRPGQQVEVVVRSEDDRLERCRELAALLEQTQSLPQVQALSEDEILRELDIYRDTR